MARKGFPGKSGMGGMNMNNMLKQAQKMQQDMAKAQEELAEQVIEVSAGGGAVTVTVTGAKEIQELKISPEVVDAEDIEMLQDLIIAAVNEAMRKADEMVSAEMGKFTGGMNIPGMF